MYRVKTIRYKNQTLQLNKIIKFMNQPAHLKRIAQYNKQIQQLRAEVSKAESKVITNAQNMSKKTFQPDPYVTPVKPTNTSTVTTTNTNPITSPYTNPSPISSTNTTNNAKQKQADQKKEQEQRLRQFEHFLTTSHKLRDMLQEKAKFIQIEYEKQRIYWQNERERYEKHIHQLNNKIEQKDKKIQEMIQKIAQLKQQLKAALQKCEQQAKIIIDLRNENSALKQENIEIKLQNKNLKADNKIVVAHLDKLINQKQKDKDKTAKEIFEQREKRVIESLYFRSFSTVTTQTRPDLLPSQRNQLSNKVKLEKTLEEYINHREESNRMIKQLQDDIRVKQHQIQAHKRRIQVLEQSLKKVTELRDMEHDSSKKQNRIIIEYEKQFQQLRKHNQCLSDQIQKYYRMPRFKEKIGCISRIKKIKQNQA